MVHGGGVWARDYTSTCTYIYIHVHVTGIAEFVPINAHAPIRLPCAWIRRASDRKNSEMDANVSQFIAITGASSEVAVKLMEMCGGNLDLAINMHLESGGCPALPAPGQNCSSTGAASDVLSPKSYEEL